VSLRLAGDPHQVERLASCYRVRSPGAWCAGAPQINFGR